MSTTRILSFMDELTKTAKPQSLGTMLGQKVVAVKASAKKGLAKKAGRMAAIKKGVVGVAKKINKGLHREPKRAIAAGSALAFMAGRQSKRK